MTEHAARENGAPAGDVREFRLPDVGEGLTEAEVLSWRVAVGDRVEVNQPLVEIETAKAAVELPSPFAGVVQALHVEPGVLVPVGTPLISVEVAGSSPVKPAAAPAHPGETAPPPVPNEPGGSGARREAVLVGYGVAPASPIRRTRRTPRTPLQGNGVGTDGAQRSGEATIVERSRVRAKPPVRHLAKLLGVDLRTVTPSGPDGVVTRSDVESAAPASSVAGAPHPHVDEQVPARGVLRAMADAMVRSASVPVAAEWLDVDVTESLRLVDQLREMPELEGVHVGPTLVVAWALCRSAHRYPRVNATWVSGDGTDTVVVHHYVNLGVAAATSRGLIVPVIQDADQLGLVDLARALHALTADARAGATSPSDVGGGTISLTNPGVFGVDGGTPLLVPGQAAILCVGQVAPRPWVVDGELAVRSVCGLTLAFDHRCVDGELAARVVTDVARTLHDPVAELARSAL